MGTNELTGRKQCATFRIVLKFSGLFVGNPANDGSAKIIVLVS